MRLTLGSIIILIILLNGLSAASLMAGGIESMFDQVFMGIHVAFAIAFTVMALDHYEVVEVEF